jgi:hypothetical protein
VGQLRNSWLLGPGLAQILAEWAWFVCTKVLLKLISGRFEPKQGLGVRTLSGDARLYGGEDWIRITRSIGDDRHREGRKRRRACYK